ncbi:MAG: LamG-like jellyroll fold domain-containing protein [Prosthecobacter sp.]|uniref:LamG-like jellyroll fold domain-containing protein n=1 Tax=Prosthecobacter sp. TaxID=1965333 RepID=UPI003902D68C
MLRLPFLTIIAALTATSLHAEFKAGAAVIDITPQKLPVLVNGGMLSRYVDKINTRVNARAIVATDGKEQIAIVVADSCMMSREVLDEAKKMAAAKTGIATDHMLISATHAHSAPASMGCLGTDPDPNYVPFLKEKLVEAIAAAQAAMVPARIGFAKANAAEFTALRQWIRRPDRIAEDPFGNKTVRAAMHAGAKWDEAVGEAGPEDPDLSLISIQTKDGKPLAVLGNFSMHYFGDKDISADYFGLFSEGLKQRIDPQGQMVGIMSHGCSGDIYRVDYKVPAEQRPKPTINEYTHGLLDIAMKAYAGIKYGDEPVVAMAEKRMTLKYRVPDKQRLEWAQRIVAAMGERAAKTPTEVYAREQIILHERQQTEIVVQALRIGDIGIATTPNETYAITGLKVKAASPLPHNMVIELANGGDGYIPPPEMHAWGGYNTWAARSAGLEVMAEPKITQTAITLLETVSGAPRKPWGLSAGPASKAVMDLGPVSFWRLNEFTGPVAADATQHHRDAAYEGGVAYYLDGPHSIDGPHSQGFCAGDVNRAPHFVGGRLCSQMTAVADKYSVSMWIWNGMPEDGRDFCGWFYSRDHNHGISAFGEHLGIGGKSGNTGRLVFQAGETILVAKTAVPPWRWTWQRVTLVRDGTAVRVYLNDRLEIEGTAAVVKIPGVFFGGRSDNENNWEGRLDEIAVFDRALSAAEVAKLGLK